MDRPIILMVSALESGKQFRRRIEVGKSLRQINRLMLIGQARHSTNDGFRETIQTSGRRRHSD